MKTGNTARPSAGRVHLMPASMEPGHEDREYRRAWLRAAAAVAASMEPGHEDREYAEFPLTALLQLLRLNGARS